MSQSFRTHRQFQLLSWIDALSRGHESPEGLQEPADEPLIDDPHRTPTVSNLAYYLLHDANYNKDALKDQFSFPAVHGTPDKDVFTYVKRDLTRHLSQYPGDLFTTKTVRKTAEDHPTFDDGLESRCVKAKAYYLTERGQNRLEDLHDVVRFKCDLVTEKQTLLRKQGSIKRTKTKSILTDDAIEQIREDFDPKTIEMDSITVPIEERMQWKTTSYTLPHVAVVDQDRTPTIYRN